MPDNNRILITGTTETTMPNAAGADAAGHRVGDADANEVHCSAVSNKRHSVVPHINHFRRECISTQSSSISLFAQRSQSAWELVARFLVSVLSLSPTRCFWFL